MADVSTTGGSLSNWLKVNDTTYTATFTSDGTTHGQASVSVSAGVFTDAAGNPNTAATQSLYVGTVMFDVLDDGTIDASDTSDGEVFVRWYLDAGAAEGDIAIIGIQLDNDGAFAGEWASLTLDDLAAGYIEMNLNNLAPGAAYDGRTFTVVSTRQDGLGAGSNVHYREETPSYDIDYSAPAAMSMMMADEAPAAAPLVVIDEPGGDFDLSSLMAVADGTGVDVDWDLDGVVDESAVVSAGQVILHQGVQGTQAYAVYQDMATAGTVLIDTDIIQTHAI